MEPAERECRRVAFGGAGGLAIAGDGFGDPAAPIVLFLHGGGQTRHAWGGSARAIAAAGYHAITVDLRGHGESAWDPAGDYDASAFAADVAAIALQLPSLPVIVGASLGGIAALLATAASPVPICRALVLVDVTPRLEARGVRRVVDFMRARPDGFADLDEAADFIAGYLPHRARPRDLAGLEKNLRLHSDGRYRWHWDPALMRIWDPDHYDAAEGERDAAARLDAARRLRMPVLLVRGRMSDVVSEAGAREFLTAVPGARYVDLQAAGHMVAGDDNDAFTGAVREFVREVVPPLAPRAP